MPDIVFARRKKIDEKLNITPLIDIVFLLLIFFMLSSHFVSRQGIKLTLPASVAAELQHQDKTIVYIDKEDTIYLNTRQIQLDDLLEELSLVLKKSKDKNVVIKADKKIDLGLAVKVMDIAKQAEAKGLVISTKSK